MAWEQVSVLLDIPDIRVLKTEFSERRELILTIESTKPGTKCRRCGRWIVKFHRHDDWVTLRHLPVFGRPSYLRYRPKRYQSQNCEERPTTTQSLYWHDANSLYTFTYDEHLLLQLVGSTITDVRLKEQVEYDVVLGVLERRTDTVVDWSAFEELEVMDLDEIALKKGHRDFVKIVTARLAGERVVLLGVLPDRQNDQVVGVSEKRHNLKPQERQVLRKLFKHAPQLKSCATN